MICAVIVVADKIVTFQNSKVVYRFKDIHKVQKYVSLGKYWKLFDVHYKEILMCIYNETRIVT